LRRCPSTVQCSSEVVVLRPHRNGGAQIAAGPILVAHDVRCLGENGQAVQSGELPDLTSDIVDNPQIDSDQPDGSAIALPPDPELRADLCAPTWKLGARGILLESKDGSSGFGNLRQRLGRSPGKGDAVVMAWSEGNAAAVSRHNACKWERPRQRWIV
jgi:hypothetical protein